MSKFLGWLFLIVGVSFALVASINAERYSQRHRDLVFRLLSQFHAHGGQADLEAVRSSMDILAQNLDEAKRFGYIFISSSMAFGAFILIRKRKSEPQTAEQCAPPNSR